MEWVRVILGCVLAAGVYFLYATVLGCLIIGRVFRWRDQRCQSALQFRVMVTGRVNSLNWCQAHLMPLAQASCVEKLLVVMDGPIIEHPKIVSYALSSSMRWRVMARLRCFFRVIRQERPHIIIGYSFCPSALVSLFTAKVVGAAAIYQMTGGYFEIMNGGISMDYGVAHVPTQWATWLRPLAFSICRHFDAIIVRGQRTRQLLMDQTCAPLIEVIAGSVNARRFARNGVESSYDIVFVGRMVSVKQPRHVLEVLARVAARRPNLQAAMVGDGPLLQTTKKEAEDLGLLGHIHFTGHLNKVEDVLTRSKIFLLTSRSEGLSIALAEAMMAGAVPVVANVGDLSELVENDKTGWLIAPGDFDGYAMKICQILEDESLYRRLARAARKAALENNSLESVTDRWTRCFRSMMQTLGTSAFERG